ncbi:trimethyllysine dioxygenase [Thalassotalea litorea]|uniref:trimethyllysine dioxygenase n=1 Tax=Thalassotalea litorea TaxID=2020715 RepID=A0A5R9ILI7_9GAMM|nr:trimethyllysine dioxygenase [Thalassotalea litorea]TLU66394.1 trimethyllysine dioxygenase [Thalassotalea litorea]
MRIHACQCQEDGISIEFSDKKTAEFSLFWLRDHSTDAKSLNPSTLQRDLDTFNMPVPKLAQQQLLNDGAVLQIHWQNDATLTEFTADFLHAMAYPCVPEPGYKLWGNELQDRVPDFDFNQISQSDAAFLPVIDAMENFGIVTFSNVPTDMSATKALLEKIGYIRESVFGGLWDFSNNQAHSDSAYTSVGIGLHTDGTYTIDPPGLQLLHCLAFEGEGAFNQFVDGFKVAQLIKEQEPQAYQTLTRIKVPAHYIEPGIQLRGEHPVVREDKNGHFEQICFNNFDRSPFKLTAEDEKAFYHAYGKYQQLVNDPALQIQFQLQPGKAVWFDNWRTLHARTAFSGFRHLAGGYTNREDYISKKLTLRGQTPWQE